MYNESKPDPPKLQTVPLVKFVIASAIPIFTFISAILIVIITYCFLFVMKRKKNEIYPSHQQNFCGELDIRRSYNSNSQNVSQC